MLVSASAVVRPRSLECRTPPWARGGTSISLSNFRWTPARPDTLVVACSDGRLQEATDEFLAGQLGVDRYDRLYLPGGAGALAATGRDYIRAMQVRKECLYLVELHRVGRIILLFHGPSATGSIEAACADYRRKLPWASVPILRTRQAQDAVELLERRDEWAGDAEVAAYRCEVDEDGRVAFVNLSTTRAT